MGKHLKYVKKVDIVSERNLNKLIVGLSKTRGYKCLKFPVTIRHLSRLKKYHITMSNYWSGNMFVLTDIIGHVFTQTYYENEIDTDEFRENYIPHTPNNHHTNKLVIFVDNVNDDITNIINTSFIKKLLNFEFIVSEKELRQYYALEKFGGSYIENLLSDIQNCEFSFMYPIRVYNKSTKKYDRIYHYINNEHLFKYELVSYDKTPTGRPRNKIYKIKFDSLLGSLFLYNLLTINFDWIPYDKNVFDMKETAQFLYRKYILTRYGFQNLKYTDETIINGLGYMTPSKSENVKSISRALDELKTHDLIKDWRYKNCVFEFIKNDTYQISNSSEIISEKIDFNFD